MFHATFAQQRPDTAAPFLYKSQGLPIHVPVVKKSGTISVRPDQVLNLDRVETDVIVNLQTSPPSGFLNANGTRFQFQLLPSNYCIVHSYVEFDISNTTSLAVQLTPLLFLVDRIRIRNGLVTFCKRRRVIKYTKNFVSTICKISSLIYKV